MTGRHPVSVKSALLIEQILCCVLDIVRNVLSCVLDAVSSILDRIGNILCGVLSSLGSVLCSFLHFVRNLDPVVTHTAVFAEIFIIKFICIIAAAGLVLTALCDHNRNSGTGGGSGKQCKSSHCFHSHSSFSARCISI